MGRFEDRLITELLDERGAALAEADRPVPVRRSRRPMWIGSGALVTALATVGLLALAGGGASPACAVTTSPDGTVTLTLAQVTGIAGANERLRELGLPVLVVPLFDRCHNPYGYESKAVRYDHGQFIFSPKDIPAGKTLIVAAEATKARGTQPSMLVLGIGLGKGRPPTCGQPGPLAGHVVIGPTPVTPGTGSPKTPHVLVPLTVQRGH